MELDNAPQLDQIFTALADPTRRALLLRLTENDTGVMELAAPFQMSQPAISRHIKVLEAAGLITRYRKGTHRMCKLAPDTLGAIEPWLDMIATRYRARYDRLDKVLEAMTTPPTGDE